MDENTFIELQRECFNIVSAILKAQIQLPKNLEISTINEIVLADLAAYVRTGYFSGHAEFIMSKQSTSGVGLPLRIVTYYNLKPLGYLCGSYDDGKFLIYHWELSDDADVELHRNWLRIIISSLEYLAVCFEKYTDNAQAVECIAFASPMENDHALFRAANFKYTDNIYKEIPAYYIER
jgi:hypothetical protein